MKVTRVTEDRDGVPTTVISLNGRPYIEAVPGGTGPCWNLRLVESSTIDDDWPEQIHVCDLDDLLTALFDLRGSPEYAANVERWAA